MKKDMLINVLQPEECRIAILEDGVLEELYVERTSHESYVGNIYKGRIVNIEPSIQAAFVDFGVGRNGFLHVSDVEPAYYRHLEQRGGGRDSDRDRRRGDGPRGRGDRDQGRRPPRRDDADTSRRAPMDFPDVEQPMVDDLDALDAEFDTPPPVESITVDTTTIELVPPPTAESEPAEDRPEPRGRGRRRRRNEPADRADRPASAEEPTAPKDEPGSDEPPETPRPRLMDSAERRTEEDSPKASVEDDDIFFPRSESESSTPPVSQPQTPVQWSNTPVGPVTTSTADRAEAIDERPPIEERDEIVDERPIIEQSGDDEDFEDFSEESMPRFHEDDEPPSSHRPRTGGERGRGGRGRDGGRDRGRDGGRDRGRRGPMRPGGMMGRPKPLIQDIFKRGQEVLVQVIKEGIGTKGPTLSTYISIAGRYLVLMPGLNRVGVSRKIADDEQRRRLRDIFHELQPPKGLGFIIRTAGMDKTKKELQRDLAYLARLWQVVVRRIRKLKAPAEIYQESDMITRTIRDTFTNDIDTIWVDEPNAYEHAKEFLTIVMPRYANRIKLFDDPQPMFHKHGIEDEIARIQKRHVPLPTGGSIVVDQTEALVAIDVNSGNFRADNNAEETAYQMNLVAAREIARQLRLRDLGGVIVNDFIDMRDEKHRRGVERALRDAVKRDRARTKILKISQFGLIEMTRQRIRPSLKRSVYQDCPHCRNTGQVKTCESMSIDVMRMLQLAAHRENIHRIQIKVAEDVANYLLNKKRKEIARLEEAGEVQVIVAGQMSVSPETLEFLCYDNNNNEVKFLPSNEDVRPRRR
ncbi:MAG: Rne/Rng family ribonuclease [Gemmataceae bacterium]|nr:Rne/Rng family ribonuclease [Gemmataceae bacterium]